MAKTRKHSGNGGGVKNFLKSLKNKGKAKYNTLKQRISESNTYKKAKNVTGKATNYVKAKGKSMKKSWNNFGRNLNTKAMVDAYYAYNFQTAPQEDKEKLYKFWVNATRRLGNNTKSLSQVYKNQAANKPNLKFKNFMEPIKIARIENEANYRNMPNLKNQIQNADFTNLEIADLFSRLERVPQMNQNGVKKHMKFVKYLKNKKTQKQNNRRRGMTNGEKYQAASAIGSLFY